jgi:hypothetical protein
VSNDHRCDLCKSTDDVQYVYVNYGWYWLCRSHR